MAKKTHGGRDIIEIECWPQLRLALENDAVALLGSTVEDVARFLIIDGIERRARERAANRSAADQRVAATSR